LGDGGPERGRLSELRDPSPTTGGHNIHPDRRPLVVPHPTNTSTPVAPSSAVIRSGSPPPAPPGSGSTNSPVPLSRVACSETFVSLLTQQGLVVRQSKTNRERLNC
jgi:hypothetical protein